MPIFEQLEPRILLSADLIPLPVDTDPSIAPELSEEPVLIPQDSSVESGNTAPVSDPSQMGTAKADLESQTADDSEAATTDTQSLPINGESDQLQISADLPDPTSIPQALVFINDDIDGFEELREDLETRENSEVIILNSEEDGLTQISTALGSTKTIQALHFFTHGNDSSVKIGSSWLNSTSLVQNQDSISSWGEHLTPEGDILFYGCDLAASTDGTDLIQEIAELTGADVAASDDATGHAYKTGDWILEYETGEIETTIAVSLELQSDWVHILAEETIADNFETAGYSNNDGSINWVSDWIEIGESDGADAGNVLVEGGELHIIAADYNEAERGISRVADLSGASSAFLSIDARGIWGGLFSDVSVEARADNGDTWSTLANYYTLTQDVTMRFDITSFISDTTEIRFVSEGFDFGGLSFSNSDFYVDNLHIDYTTDNWSMPLWLSTENSVSNGGQAGIDSWDKADLIGLDNSSPLLGTQTYGEFSMAAQLSVFSEGAEVNALHYVTTNMLIGASEFELKVGDILFSSENPDQKSFGNIDASRDDIIHFRPSTSGDYSAGTFTILFDEVVKDKKVWGLTLVEKDVTVGDRDLHAGDLLFIRDGGGEHSDVYHYATIDVEPGSGNTNGTVSVLLEGDDNGIDISEQLRGIDLVERTVTIGDTQLEEGTILLSIKENDSINGTNIGRNDIFALNVTTTSDPDGDTDDLGNATASKFFDGSDVSFNSNEEKIDAFSLTVRHEIPEPTFTSVSFDAQAKAITLTGTNLDYLGDIGTIEVDQLDWSKIIWDINGDGSTTADITFDINNVSSVLTSSTTLTINLTDQKTNEITGTDGYAEDGGTDTLTIIPGFVSNESGDLATTDGLTDAPISTRTAPVGVDLSNSSIPENTDTTGGLTVGTLSTTDADSGDTQTYTITGGVDSGLFSIGGTNGDELILDAGQLDHEQRAEYVVEITVTDSTGQTAIQLQTISVSNVDETPVIIENSLVLNEDQTVTLTTADIAATDEESIDGNLIFNIETVVGGQFEHKDLLGLAITSFTQADIAAGKIIFIDNGDETAPSYSLSVFDGALTSAESAAAITFTRINDAPVISNNSLNINEGQPKTLTTADLTVNDGDNSSNELVFTINSVSEGQFELSTELGTAISSFTQDDLIFGRVQFVHNGGETTPAYNLTLSDGQDSFGPSDATITLTNINDQPTIQHNSLDILQGQTVLITPTQLLASDPDDNATALIYTISNLVAGSKFITTGDLGETAITSFTQNDINLGLISFVHDITSPPPAYNVEVRDGTLSSGISAANVNFNTVNLAPSFDINSLTLDEGESVSLTSANFLATDFDHGPASLIFTVAGVSQGQFQSTDNLGVSINSFTQADINAGKIIFKHDGGEVGPSYTATVSDGSLNDSLSSSIAFTPVNDAPEITTNTITMSEGETVLITPAILSATDVDDLDPTLTFTVSGVTGGMFTTTTDTTTALSSFSQAQITAGNIQFIHNDGENAPTYQITVTDGSGLTSPTQAANVVFTGINDTPQLTTNNLIVNEGGTVTISAANLSASDAESISANLTFTVSSMSGGQFEHTSLAGSEVTSFSQAEILAGEIIFVHDGDETAPVYQITVTDDDASPLTTTPTAAAVTFTSVNDAPDLSVNTITLAEGATITFDNSMLAATDSDSSEPDLIFTVTDLVAGTFINTGAPTTAITSFSQAQVTNGEIRIIHDGGEDALSYHISVSDGNLITTAAPASVNFTGVNDAPTLSILASDESYTEDTTHTLSDISIADSDGGTNYQVSLDLSDDSAGTLSETAIGTATGSFTGGTLTISGSDINDVNAVLATTIFTPASNYNDDFTITIAATDGLAPANPLTKTLHPIIVNDAPSAILLNQSATYTEDMSFDLQDIIVTDIDEGEILSASMTLASPGHGTLSTAGGANFDASTGTWSVTGTVAEVNNALSLVSFTPAADSLQSTTIAVQIEDGKEDGVTALAGTINLTGKAVADAPIVADVAPVPPAAIPEPDSGVGSPDTSGDDFGEEVTIVEDTSSVDETLELVTGLDTDANDSVVDNEDSSSTGDENETTPETETTAHEEVEDSLSYVNAKKISDSPSSNQGVDVSAVFDNINFNFSFASTVVNTFSQSSVPSLTIESDSLSLSGDPEKNEIYSTSNYNLLDLEYRDRSFEEYQSVRKSLESFREQTEQEASIEKTVVGSAIAASTGLSAGYVIWLLRSGALLSSILSSLPAWQLADPLAVLVGAKGEEDEEDDSIESIIKKGTNQPTSDENTSGPQKDTIAD